jgi:hypothetical protein
MIEDPGRATPGLVVWGEVSYDAASGCIRLLTSETFVDRDVLDRAVDVAWPKGSRPVVKDGVQGVRVGGLLGLFGGQVILDGDLIWGGGSPAGTVDHSPTCNPDSLAGPATLASVTVVTSLEHPPVGQ